MYIQSNHLKVLHYSIAIITERLAIPNINGNKSIDRLWCVCDTDGYVQDIRVQPHFATIAVEIDYEHNCLVLTPLLMMISKN